MLNVTNEVNQAWLQPSRQLEVKIFLNGEVYENDRVTSLSFEEESIVGESFQIGSTFINQLSVVFPEVIENLSIDQELTAEVGILVDETYHYSKLGKFIISECNRDRNNKTTTITALDQMILLEGVYDSKLTYPARIRDVALEIANLSGVEIDQVSFSTLPTTTIRKPEGYTHRQAIGLIAQFIGGFANFNRDGKLQVKRLNTTNFTIKPENYMLKGFTKNESTYRPNGITVRTGDEETDVLRVGSSSGNIISLENKIMTQPLLNSIWQYVKDITYFPFELKWQGNPNLEAGDWIYIEDREGHRYSVPNLSFSFTYNGGMRADSKATTSSSSEVTYRYRGTLKQQIEEIRGVLESATGGNHNYYDSETEPPNPKIGDLWFKKNGADTEIWIYRVVDGVPKWDFEISTAPNESLLESIQQAIQAGEEAKLAGEQATQAGLEAKQAGQQAEQAGLEAKEAGERAELVAQQAEETGANALAEAELAKSVGQQAKTAGETAQQMVSDMETDVQKAITDSDNAVTVANQAVEAAGFATDTANTAHSLATSANQSAQDAVSQSSQAHQLAVQSATDASDALDTATGLLGRMDSAEGTITGVQTSIDDITGELEHKVSQTDFNTLEGTVDTHTGLISANSQQIALKASQSSVDTLSGRVNTAEGQISVQAGQIAQRLTASEVNSLVDGKGYATTASVNSQVSRIDGDINSWSSQLQTVQAEVDGIEAGQKNLFIKTAAVDGYLSNTNGNIYPSIANGEQTSDFIDVSGNEQIVIGYFFSPTNSHKWIAWSLYDENKETNARQVYPLYDAEDSTDSWSRIISIPSNIKYIRVSARWIKDGQCQLFIGRGNTAPLDWSPAPEDLATVTALTTNVNQINQTISETNNSIQLLTQTVTQNGQDISSVSADLTVADGKITGLTSKTDGHTTQIGNLQSGYDGLQSTVATVRSDLDGMEIGGRNLIIEKNLRDGFLGSNGSLGNSANGERTSEYIDIHNHAEVTLSYYWGITASYKWWAYQFFTENKDPIGVRWGEHLSDTENSLEGISKTINVPSNAKYILVSARWIYAECKLKLEKGNKATDWSPAPEDMATQSQITQLSSQIDLRVTKADLISQINVQAGRVLIRANDNVLMVTPSTTYIQDATIKTAHIADANISTAKIANLAVSEGKIANLAVTDAKIASLTANKLTAGTIDASVITVSKINASNITTGQMEVARLKVADLRVNTANINDLQVSTAKLANLSVSEGKIANLAVATGKIADLAVTGAKIANATIGTAKIGDLQVTGAKIADATIASAKIISLDVNKLVANNASVNKLSAISANLGDVTAGSITGVTITGGIITQTNNKYTMNMSNGALRFARGGSDIGYLGVANDASKNPIGMAIFQYPGEIFSIASLNSAGTTSSNVFVIPSSSSQGNAQWRLNGEGIIQAGSLAVNAPMTVEAAATFNRNVTLSRELNIGDSNREHKIFEDVSNYKLIFRSEYGYEFYYNRSNIYERMITIENNKVQIGGGSQGGDGYFNDTAAGMSFGRDGGTNAGGNRIWSRAIYNRTYSGSSNMYITDAGTIGRSTSARKYKTDIQVANQAIVNAQKVLQIQPSSWLDKAAVESGKSTHRYYGFIADDFHDKGLKEVVMYGSDGQVESLAYDRISMYHNVILADHEKQLRDIKNENMRMIGEISMLRNEVESLRQLVA